MLVIFWDAQNHIYCPNQSTCFVGDMIKLFKVKEKQRELAENASGGVPVKKQSAGELRLHKGLYLNLSIVFANYFLHL